MTRRGWIAAAVLTAWAVTLAWHVKRTHLRPAAEVLAAAARTLPPGDAYYAVWQGNRRVGWARSLLDTLPAGDGFLLEERMELTLAPGGAARVELEAELGPALELRRFWLESRGAPRRFRVEGEVRGDTLRAVLRERRTTDSLRVPLDGPLMLSAAWPLRVAAQGGLRPGDRFRIPSFDPATLSPSEMEVTVLERGRRSYPDSVDTAPDGGWLVVREDTVEAWRVEREVLGVPLRSWVDEDGRLLESQVGGGLRLERTAFEIAFYGTRAAPEDTVAPEGGDR